MPFFDYLSRTPAAGSLFDRAMTSAGWLRYRFLLAVDAYNFGKFKMIVDIGGGNGTLMVELLKKYPQPTGTLFDVPRLADATQQTIEAAGLTARCQFLGGNAFEAVRPGADAYLLSNFVINWGDEEAVEPLRNCRKVIAEVGKLLLVEWIVPTGDEPKEGFRFWDAVTMDLRHARGLRKSERPRESPIRISGAARCGREPLHRHTLHLIHRKYTAKAVVKMMPVQL
jgi:hypothetical protein